MQNQPIISADADTIRRVLAPYVLGANYGSPGVERFVMRQRRGLRRLLMVLLWPPLRLNLLKRWLPGLPVYLHVALYVPTLLLTPRPLALRWHWAQYRGVKFRALPPTRVLPDAKSPLRIFHGPQNIAGIATAMARAERAIGLDAKAICFASERYGFEPDALLAPTHATGALQQRFLQYGDAFDVFVFHYGISLTNDALADIPLLKQMGKQVIFYFHGCDIRDRRVTIKKYSLSACKECWPPRCSSNRNDALRMAEAYADAIGVSTPDLLEFLPGAQLFLQPVALPGVVARSTWKCGRPLRIIHSPSDAQLKGTRYLLDAVSALQKEGHAIELILLKDVPHEEVLQRIADADLGMDQILQGVYGTFAVELMAAGVPVMGYLREDTLQYYGERPPLIEACPNSIYRVLTQVLAGAIDLAAYAVKGRAFAERYHAVGVAAQQAQQTYHAICTRECVAGA